MRWLIVLALVGCANKADLYEAARACGTVSECPEEWDEWNKAELRKQDREKPKCPQDTVMYSDGRSEGCISQDEMRRLLDSLQRGYYLQR